MLGSARRPNVCRHSDGELHLLVGTKDAQRHLSAHIFVLRVADHSDNFNIGFGAGVATHADVLSEGALSLEISLGELLVDDGNLASILAIRVAKVPAFEQRHPERVKVAGSKEVHVRIDPFAGACLIPFDGHPAVPLAVVEYAHDREAGRLNSGDLIELIFKLPVERDGSLRRVAAPRGIERKSQNVFSSEAGVEVFQGF